MSIRFDVTDQVDLGRGFRLLAGGFRGTGSATEPSDYSPGATRSASTEQVITGLLADALDRADMREETAIELSLVPEPGTQPSRSVRQEDALILETPDLGEQRAQVVMLTDEDGGVSFHYPVSSTDDPTVEPPSVRGGGGVKTFVIPAEVPPGQATDEETRGLVGLIGRKLIQVLSFPVVAVVGRAVGEPLVRRWEEKNRPYGVRWFGPDSYRSSGGEPVDDWASLHSERTLLFVHGTFSTARGGFGGVPGEVMEHLWERYDGRVIAFNHHSISASPVDNCRWFIDQVPDGIELDLDIVAHSRGGLVARVLAGEHPDADLDLSGVRVGAVVCGGTPNYGTPLADAEHLSSLLDRMATVSNLVPGVPAAEIIDAVLLLVQVIAQAVLEGLRGLEVMKPGSEFLNGLNAAMAGDTRYLGIAASYEPTQRGMRRVVEGLKDGAVDFVFGGVDNDLVVPTAGVYTGNAGFAISPEARISFGPERGVFHATFWREPEVVTAFREWLPAGLG